MKPKTQQPVPSPDRPLALAVALTLALAVVAMAQPPRPGPPGAAGEMLAFEVQSVDPQGWIVTARDLESGDEFRFRLPPEVFRGQRFRADLSGAGAGRRISVVGERDARLRQVMVERPLGKVRHSESAFGGRGPGDPGRGPDRYAVPDGPGDFAVRDEPRDSSRYRDRPGRLGERAAGGAAGPSGYEVVAVDSTTWTVTARGDDGEAVSLQLDPQAFVGYRFRASVKDLRAGEGFELLADNESPLVDCCTLKDLPRR